MYTKTDYEKDRDLIRQYDGVKFEFPRTDTAGKKVNILYRIPHLDGLYIKTGSYGDSFMVCFDEPEYNLSNVKKEVDEYEKHRTILKQVQSAMDRVKEYESVNGEPTGSGTAGAGKDGPKEYSWEWLFDNTTELLGKYDKFGNRFRTIVKRSTLWKNKEITIKPKSKKLLCKPTTIRKIRELVKDCHKWK